MPAHPTEPDTPLPATERMPATERTFVVGALGHRVRVTVGGEGAGALGEAFADAWSHLLLSGAADGGAEVAEQELSLVARSGDTAVAAALADASARITRALIDLSAGRGLLFHAAAVPDQDGGAILLVGPSGAGKTTAVARLAAASGYLTDEMALVGADGAVLPYPKPLSVGRGGPVKAQLAPRALGLAVAEPRPHPVSRVIVLDRDPGLAGPPRSRRLDLIESLESLVPQLSGLARHPRPLRALAELIRQVGGIELLTYADAHALDPVAGPPAAPPGSAEEFAFTAPSAGRDTAEGTPGLVRTAAGDAVEAGGLLALAHGGEVRVLAGIAGTLWRETAQPRTEDALLARLRDAHGAAPGDDAAFRDAVGLLVDAGVLEWRR